MSVDFTRPGGVQLLSVLLTDVEASTRAWQQKPPTMLGALDALDGWVSTHAEQFDGEVVKARVEGDSHFVVFILVSSAVLATRRSAPTAAPAGQERRPNHDRCQGQV